jgi:hypothetical protein
MSSPREVRIDPTVLEQPLPGEEMHLIVAHSTIEVTLQVLQRASGLVQGLNPRIRLLAVHAVPFPAEYGSAAVSHAHLVGQLTDLAGQCPFPVTVQVVMARHWDEGFRFALQEQSMIFVGARKQARRSSEERLARVLARDGHDVVLFHVA